jgi:hypothetical protein
MYAVVSMTQFTANNKENGSQVHVNSSQHTVTLDPTGVVAIFSKKPLSTYA